MMCQESCKSRRRTRRGKKRRSHEQQQPLDKKCIKNVLRKRRAVQIRPFDVPKAPANFTQFIIDDHFESCPGLYQSFETPPPMFARDFGSSDSEAPHSSVNYDSEAELEQPLDYSQMMAFYEKDFEEVYSDARAAEVIDIPREELVVMYGEMEKKASQLTSRLSVYSPQHLLEYLQRRLLDLQEENRDLKAKNRALRYEHSEDSEGSMDSESDSSSSSASSTSSSSSSDDEGANDVQGMDQNEVTQALPDCAEVNDNAMFKVDGQQALEPLARSPAHCANDGSSSTLDFRSFQDALFHSSSSLGNSATVEASGSNGIANSSPSADQVTSSCKTPVATSPYGEIEAMG